MGILLGIFSFFVFLFFQAQGIAAGDSGDLVTAACTFGVPHPPGYPLYTFFGYILCRLPLFTPSWRVALLSSIPHALVIAGLFYLIRRMTKNTLVSIFGALVILGNYLFFLYSVTPEVFALLDLFIVVLTILLFRFTETKDIRVWYAAMCMLGLSLTHHHVILFFIPAFAYWTYAHISLFKRMSIISVIAKSILFFIVGLLPYVYVVVAGYGSSIIVWDQPTTVSNIIRLVTRSDYGTFLSSSSFGVSIQQRILSIQAYMQFMYMDFRLPGVLGVLFGFYALWRRKKQMFWFFMLGIFCTGPFFFFYASFPLLTRFTLATYERFLLPSYVVSTVVLSIGVFEFYQFLIHTLSRYRSYLFTHVVSLTYIGFFGMYVLFMFAGVTYRFWGLPQDRTVDLYGADVLASLPQKSIIFLKNDTQLFSVQYMRYAVGMRPDVVVLHNSRLANPEYLSQIRKIFPEIIFPSDTNPSIHQDIISANYPEYRIFTNMTDAVVVDKGYIWVPNGLVFELYPKDAPPEFTDMQTQNDRLWQGYHDPSKGILQRYNHMMISDIRDVYAYSRLEYGKVLFRAREYPSAISQFTAAIAYSGDTFTSEAYMNLGLAQVLHNNCDEAVISFQRARSSSLGKQYDYTKEYEAEVYRTCLANPQKAKQLEDEYNASKSLQDIPLNKL